MDSWILEFSTIQVALLLFMEYVDLGKWVAATEGGSHLGLGLTLLLFFNFTAGLWHYLSSCICLVTGNNLAQICSQQYSRLTCVLFGTAVAISMIASDLTKILSVAHGHSVLFDLDLFSSTFLAAIVAVVHPILFSLLGSRKLMALHLIISNFISFFYVLGVHLYQLEAASITHNDHSGVDLMNAFMLMALLGAQIAPHNFFIHSYIVQQQRRQLNTNKDVVIQTHLFAIVFIFTSVFLVNAVIMNSAASVFNSYGFLVPSFQDDLMFVDQIFRSPASTFPTCLCFLFSSLVVAITHSHVGQVISRDFFLVNFPVWVYHIIPKVFSVAPALYCAQQAGSEGIHQLLLFCQVISAIILPLSVIPLFQLSSSQLIMGAFRISPFVEFLSMIALTGMLATNGFFVIELLSGDSEWSAELRGNMENGFTLLYSFLILLALASLIFTLYLFFTPLRPSVNQPHMKISTGELQKEQTMQSESREQNDSNEVLENKYQNSIAKIIHGNTLNCLCDCSFIESSYRDPETNVGSEQGGHKSDLVPNPTATYTSYRASIVDEAFSSGLDILDLPQHKGFIESNNESLILQRGVTPEDDQPNSCEPTESSCISGSKLYGSNKSMMTDKGVNVVSGEEAASGLGQRGKRQVAVILDEFWGLLFDYHGKLSKEAKSIRAAILLGLDCQPSPTATESETAIKASAQEGELEIDRVLPTLPTLSSHYNSSPVTLTVPSAQSPYIVPIGAQPWSPVVQYQDWQLTMHGAGADTNYRGFWVQTISNSVEPLKLDSETEAVPLTFAEDSESRHYEDDISKPFHLISGYETFWTKNCFIPSVNSIGKDNNIYCPYETLTWGGKIIHSMSGAPKIFLSYGESERLVLQSLRFCIRKLVRVHKSAWLFSQNGGLDEELIDYLAMTEGILHNDGPCEVHEDLIIFIPNWAYCSKDCIWQASLVVSFGVWCVRRILELLLVEGRPEIWGKFTYVLNRLQGILDPAFCKSRKVLSPCKCLQACGYSRESSGTASLTCRSSVLELIKEVQASTLKRKGPAGTGGDGFFSLVCINSLSNNHKDGRHKSKSWKTALISVLTKITLYLCPNLFVLRLTILVTILTIFDFRNKIKENRINRSEEEGRFPILK